MRASGRGAGDPGKPVSKRAPAISNQGSVTIKDVARKARVSIRTVSRVINRSPMVGEATRVSVQQVIDKLGFAPNRRGRALASGKSFLLGVVQDDPNAHVIGVFQEGIVSGCSASGYELLVHPTRLSSPAVTVEIADFVARTQVDGLILLPPLSENADIPLMLNRLEVPCVGIAAIRVPGYSAMLIGDERGAAADVANHLVSLGHRKLALVTGPLTFFSSSEREQGFRSALASHGIELPSRWVLEGDYGFQSGLDAGLSLLAGRDRPTAIFASNDIMAAGVLRAAAARGIPVPEQLSVAGFDDSDLAGMVTPPLTTIHRPLLEMARTATEQLVTMIQASASERLPDIKVSLSLVVRQSTASAPRS